MNTLEKLTIIISYNEKIGLSITEFNNCLYNLNKAYSKFTNKTSELHIKSISHGSMILDLTEKIIIPVLADILSAVVSDFRKHIIIVLRMLNLIQILLLT